jgi:hypothetical protein
MPQRIEFSTVSLKEKLRSLDLGLANNNLLGQDCEVEQSGRKWSSGE